VSPSSYTNTTGHALEMSLSNENMTISCNATINCFWNVPPVAGELLYFNTPTILLTHACDNCALYNSKLTMSRYNISQ
jgi:hypothetical protein